MFSYQKSFVNPTLPVDEAQFYALVRATQWAENIDKFRETGDAQLKRKLPAFIFQATFDETTSKNGKVGCWRKQAATRLTGLVVMDIDHVPSPREAWEGIEREKLKDKREKLDKNEKLKIKNDLGILLVYVTPSGHGLKVVFKARTEWGNLIDNQHQMAKLLGVEVDESCKDASRMSFICKESDILYMDNELFTYENKEFAERYNEEYRQGKSGETLPQRTLPQPLPVREGSGQGTSAENTLPTNVTAPSLTGRAGGESTGGESSSFRGIPYTSIIAEWWRRTGGEPVEGERNVRLYQLAVNLRSICDNRKDLLMQVMPRLGLSEQELQGIVDSACKEPPKGISKMLRSILKMGNGTCPVSAPSLTGRAGGESTGGESTGGESGKSGESSINTQLEMWGREIEALSEDYPILKDITKGLKRNQYPAALFVGGGLLMTLMTRCTYRFYHRPEELRRLNNSTLIIGDPASGKSFATRLYKLLTKPIAEVDRVGREAINAYREQMKTKGANKEKPKRPKVVLRIHPARTSNAQFILDMVNSVEKVDGEDIQLHMLTFDTELDNSLSVQRGGSWIDKQSLQLKAFHNEEDGQAYSNVDSVLEDFYVTWNYIYTGTPIALKKMVNEQNFGSGLATRLTCIPLPATGYEMLNRESEVDVEGDQRLSLWARRLDRTKGELPMATIVDNLYDWTERRMMDARDNDSRADEMLLKRCAYHAVNFAAPFIAIRHWEQMRNEGDMWVPAFETDEVDWRLAELICNIQFACQRYFFSQLAEKYFDNKLQEAAMGTQRRRQTIECFNRLPEEFTTEDVIRCYGLKSENAARMYISRLASDGLIKKIGDGRNTVNKHGIYQKTGKFML